MYNMYHLTNYICCVCRPIVYPHNKRRERAGSAAMAHRTKSLNFLFAPFSKIYKIKSSQDGWKMVDGRWRTVFFHLFSLGFFTLASAELRSFFICFFVVVAGCCGRYAFTSPPSTGEGGFPFSFSNLRWIQTVGCTCSTTISSESEKYKLKWLTFNLSGRHDTARSSSEHFCVSQR